MTSFHQRFGFDRASVGLHNWRERPFSKWSFQHVGEIVPSAIVPARGAVESAPENPAGTVSSDALLSAAISIDDAPTKVEAFLQASETDLFLVMKDGKILADWRAPHAEAHLPHIVFSVSKSVTGILAGILQDRGVLDPQKPVAHYLPQTLGGGYADCPLQHVLDMRVSLDFSEEYLNEDGDYARYRRATLWNPPLARQGAEETEETLEQLLCAIPKGAGGHGGPFRYRSPNSDLLGLVLERATGETYSQLLSDLLWRPMGAETDGWMTVDRVGAPRSAGGLSVTAGDLLSLGRLLLRGGAAEGGQVVPEAWVADMLHGGDTAAWEAGDFAAFLPGARYRNQFYQLAAPSRAFMAIGIHGQWLYVDPQAECVIVRLSSQSLPQDDALDMKCVSFLRQMALLA